VSSSFSSIPCILSLKKCLTPALPSTRLTLVACRWGLRGCARPV
jgi:hypothetical protein